MRFPVNRSAVERVPFRACWLYRVVPARSRPCYPRDRMTLCVHEAGHLIVGVAMGITQTGAAVWNDGEGIRGRVEHGHHAAPEIEDWRAPGCVVAALQLAAWFQAGVMAEMLLHGCDDPACVFIEDTADARNTRRAFEIVEMHEIGSIHGPLYAAQRWAGAMIKANWSEVKRLAAILDVHGALDAEDVQKLSSA